MTVDLEKLEDLYADILAIVRKQVTKYSESDELDERAIKAIVELDKVTRAALERFEGKRPKGMFADTSTEDLMGDFK
jgi:hypothetical protein